jgi:hypothetical protein
MGVDTLKDGPRPAPGPLVDGTGQLDLHLAQSYMARDRRRDILAGKQAAEIILSELAEGTM